MDLQARNRMGKLSCLRPTDESANAPISRGARPGPIPSKGKQRIGAVSYRKRSIETQTAVVLNRSSVPNAWIPAESRYKVVIDDIIVAVG